MKAGKFKFQVANLLAILAASLRPPYTEQCLKYILYCGGGGLSEYLEDTEELASGQSYKHFTLVNYDSRAVIWSNFQSGMTLES